MADIEQFLEQAEKEAGKFMKGPNKYYYALIAMLHWTEGNKNDFVFTNTNPEMVKAYINLLNSKKRN